MLAREQRGRHDDGHLLARHRLDKRGAQRHFGFSKAHIAADQPIHRPALRQILDRFRDGLLLIVRLLIGKLGAEFVIKALRRIDGLDLLQLARGRDADQLRRDFAHAFLHARLAALPARAAQAVQLGGRIVRAVTRQQLDILHRQEQLAAVILQFQAVMRRIHHVDRLQARETADAMFDMGDEIAGREARRFGKEILRALGAPARAHHAVAQDVLLGDDGEIRRFETMLEPQHADTHAIRMQLQRIRPVADMAHGIEAVIGEHASHALGRTFAPRRHDHALVLRLQRFDMRGGDLEHIDFALRAFGREIARRPSARIDGAFRFRRLERR